MKKQKDKLMVVFILLALIGGFVWSQINGMEHIEDINGPDDYSLAVITDEEITAKGAKQCVGGPNTSKNKTSSMRARSSQKWNPPRMATSTSSWTMWSPACTICTSQARAPHLNLCPLTLTTKCKEERV